MNECKGFSELKNAVDLVRKLEFDLERMKNDMRDQYAAYDFFVTAEHIVDWVCPNNRSAQKHLRGSSVLLQVASHIANGAKHFQTQDSRHKSVSGVKKQRYVEEGYVEEGYFEDPIIVSLAQNEAVIIGCEEISAIVLAEKLLEYWKSNTGCA